MPKYYPINEEAAKRAKDMNSFSDYAPGSATAGYQQMVDEAYALAEKQKAQVDPMYHDKIDTLVDRYARKLAENLNERNVIDARMPSILISGGGNFPVTKKHKQNAARDRNYGEYAEISKLLDKIRSVGMGGISADDDLAVEKLTKKLEGLESLQATMKAVNAYFRKHKTLDGCPELTPEQAEKLASNFGGGMKCGGTCGVITSGLLVLGGKGIESAAKIGEFRRRIAENHDGMTDCKLLLKANAERGGNKKEHCDGMIREAITLIDELVSVSENKK